VTFEVKFVNVKAQGTRNKVQVRHKEQGTSKVCLVFPSWEGCRCGFQRGRQLHHLKHLIFTLCDSLRALRSLRFKEMQPQRTLRTQRNAKKTSSFKLVSCALVVPCTLLVLCTLFLVHYLCLVPRALCLCFAPQTFHISLITFGSLFSSK
jgi:hypothetical protein